MPVAWAVGRWPGVIVAVASAAMWYYADTALKAAQPIAAIAWNVSSRLAIFVFGAWLVDVIKQDRSRLRQIDAQRDEFLRVLEHELPVPAQEMIQSLNEAQATGTLDAAGIESLRHRAESLLFLTRDFVALGQAQARRLELKRVPIDVAQLVSEVARERPDRASVLVTVPGDGLLVIGDHDRLRQSLSDTIAQVMNDAGRLEYVSVNVRASGAMAVVTVSAALPATATREERGMPGMSLQLARLLIEAMGGSLVIERAPLGKGTRATIRLPLATPAATAPAVERPAPRPR